jgi:hypothetical protein
MFGLLGIGQSEIWVGFQSKKYPLLHVAEGSGARRVGALAEHFRTSTAALMPIIIFLFVVTACSNAGHASA